MEQQAAALVAGAVVQPNKSEDKRCVYDSLLGDDLILASFHLASFHLATHTRHTALFSF